jgi:hypothetical protein
VRALVQIIVGKELRVGEPKIGVGATQDTQENRIDYCERVD